MNDRQCIYFQGLLREDDLEHFDEEFRKNFTARQVDMFSEDGLDGDDLTFFFQYATRGQ